MINAEALEKSLCRAFCSSITINPVPCGYAVSTFLGDRSGDLIVCYIVKDKDGYRIEDDGEYLSRLIGSGIAVDQGMREKLLDDVLGQSQSSWDRNTFIIRSSSLQDDEIGRGLIQFVSSLARVHDLELMKHEVVRSTFREDAIAALEERFGEETNFAENEPVDDQFSEFPSDLIILPKRQEGTKKGAFYFVTPARPHRQHPARRGRSKSLCRQREPRYGCMTQT